MPQSLVILGATASGKTGLAVDTALALETHGGADVVSADSMQVYRGLDIGTAKPPLEERQGVRHHLIDICDPRDAFSVDHWLRACEEVLADVHASSRLPIIAGGTHLYIKAFLDGLFDGPPGDDQIRASLQRLTPAELRRKLEAADPEAAGRIHPNDTRRTIRALEVYELTGTPISALQQQWSQDRAHRDVQVVAIEWPVQELNRRINARVRQMVDDGLVDEVRSLQSQGLLGVQAREALGYKQVLTHLEGGAPLEDAIEQIKIETRRYAKNQRTWLRRLIAEQRRLADIQAPSGANDGISEIPARPPLVIDAGATPREVWLQSTVNAALAMIQGAA